MSFVNVDGYDFPSPKRGVKITVVTMVNAGRNANATVVAQKIGRDQYKIDEQVFPWLDTETWSRMLSILDKFFVNVTFNDPVTNKPITIKMYPGDRSAEPYYVDGSGKPLFYTNCKVNLVDCGE